MIIRLYIYRVTPDRRKTLNFKWEGRSVEHGIWSCSDSKTKLIKDLCSRVHRYASSCKYSNSMWQFQNISAVSATRLALYRKASTWKTFKFGKVTAKVKIVKGGGCI